MSEVEKAYQMYLCDVGFNRYVNGLVNILSEGLYGIYELRQAIDLAIWLSKTELIKEVVVDDVRVSINKTANSKTIQIEIRSPGKIEKIILDQNNFTNALFGLAEVEAKRRTRVIKK